MSDADGPSDAGTERPNLLTNGHCDDLEGWGAYNGTLTLDEMAHTGTGACRVCTDLSENRSSLDAREGMNGVALPPPGAVYRAEAWVQLFEEGPTVFAALRTYTDGSQDSLTEGEYLTPTAGAWTFVEVTHQVPSEQTDVLDYYVYQYDANGDCMLVDDLHIERVR